jgi:hypothetical protein
MDDLEWAQDPRRDGCSQLGKSITDHVDAHEILCPPELASEALGNVVAPGRKAEPEVLLALAHAAQGSTEELVARALQGQGLTQAMIHRMSVPMPPPAASSLSLSMR